MKAISDNKLWKFWVYPVSILGLMFIFTGLYSYLVDIGPNKCEMTYMFEYPTYTPLKLPAQINQLFPQYALYAYSEGSYESRVRRNEFRGIPVLFLPGNGGSYRQVRSLASVSLRKSEDARLKKWFDYFSVDFNEELSGFVGSLLEKQTQFATRVIDHVLSFYPAGKRIILVGHSMGGVVARAILSRGYGDRIYLIYTQATPHLGPPMAIDKEILAFYEKMRLAEAAMKRFDTPIVSVSGGRRDVIVPDHLTSLDEAEVSRGSLSVSTTSIPKVWASTDHLCVVWCKQLVLATVRSMFDLVDADNALIGDGEKRAAVLYHHFLAPKPDSRVVDLPADAVFEETTLPSWRYHADRGAERTLLFRWSVEELKALGDLLTVVGNALTEESLISCDSGTCRTIPHVQRLDGEVGTVAVDLSSEPEEKIILLRIPSSSKKRAPRIDFSLTVVEAESVKVSPDKSWNFVLFDADWTFGLFGDRKFILRDLDLTFGGFLGRFVDFASTFGDVRLTFDGIANAVHLDLSSLWPYFVAKVVRIEPLNESTCRVAPDRRVYVKLWVPWANDDVHYAYDCQSEETEEMVLAIATPRRPAAAAAPTTDKIPVLSLWKTNEEAFSVTVSTSVLRTLGHYFRFQAVSFILYGYLASWILYFTFAFLSAEAGEVSVCWLFALVSGLAGCLNKTSLVLGLILFSNLLKEYGLFDDVAGIVDSARLHERGLSTLVNPLVNFGVGFAGVVPLTFVSDKLSRFAKCVLDYFVGLVSRAGAFYSCLYCLWSICLVISPLLDVSCTHLLCLIWLIARKRDVVLDPLRLDAIVILQRFMLFGLAFPSLVVLVKNLIETRFHSGYLLAEILSNVNAEHTCLGLLMWTGFHFGKDHGRSPLTDTFAFSLFTPLLMTTEYSFRKCILFDLSQWVVIGGLTLVNACFRFEKRKTD